MSSCDLDYVVDETGFPPGSPDKLNWMMEGIIKIRSFFYKIFWEQPLIWEFNSK